jgi:hypothetical protein
MIESSGVGRLDGLVAPTVSLLELADGRPQVAIGELARGAKAANASEQVAILADIVDAAILVAMATGRTADAIELRRSVDAMRRQAQVQRGLPEQVELDAAFDGIDGLASGTPADVDRSRVVDLIVGLAGD